MRYMNGTLSSSRPAHCNVCYTCNKFRLKPAELREKRLKQNASMNGESNLGQWTMRICDFMVDHLGEWVSGFEIVVVSLCFFRQCMSLFEGR